MRAPISIVIPTLNAETGLPRCLEALVEGLEAGMIRELIVSDGGSSDASGAVAQAWGAQVLQGAPSRGGQLRAGCAAAKGEWLFVLHADSVLPRGWTGPVGAHLSSGKAGWGRLRFDRGGLRGRIVAGWANLRSAVFGLPYGDQGLLIPRALYEQVGGYADQPLMEDVALARALRGHLAPLDLSVTTSADKYVAQGWLRRGGRNLWILLRYLSGAAPEALARSYRK
ncbi:MAG: TIGR04283 family arsenosugar biosynthesis glycosyltransferase [Sulfitobacter sp.]